MMLGFGPFGYLYNIESHEREQDILKNGSGNGIKDRSGCFVQRQVNVKNVPFQTQQGSGILKFNAIFMLLGAAERGKKAFTIVKGSIYFV